ncbi:MAG: DUF3341 domain-containing protein [Deltaproteobacteria bacterium]|nr:DUF3341 domain-containing protein [Deltaproteobacteria bacterium]MCB9788296.1 DUF3341 domain-containing protein [Deltaproteobacteria bacterium]
MREAKPWGMLAEFENTQTFYKGCEKIRDAGFSRWDAYSPFPVHGLDKAMGLKRSNLPWIVLICGLIGASVGFAMQTWVATTAYPVIISGKPFFSWQAFVPITFELGVLFGAFGAVFGMFGINKLPTYYHPVFTSDRFARVTDDRFFIAVEAQDPSYDERKTKKLLESAGATHIEQLED